jgi:putative ATP-binding cassette transporter
LTRCDDPNDAIATSEEGMQVQQLIRYTTLKIRKSGRIVMDLHVNNDSKLLIDNHRYTAWGLIKLLWRSEYRRWAYFFFSILIFLTIVLVGFDVAFTYWFNYFYDALQAYDKTGVIKYFVIFILLAAGYIIIAVYRYYLSQLFALRWRNWLTNQFINRWLKNRDYYYLEMFDPVTDNPDQRIQEDINGLISNFISLTLGLVSAVTTFPAFLYILWNLSGVISIPLGALGVIHIKGYLVWVAIIYNAIGTWITFKIGRPLIHLNFEQQQLEATFRFSAIDLRSHAEQVALYHGEEQQKNIIQTHFKGVLNNWYEIVLRQKLLLWFTAGFNQTAIILPLLASLPNYFNRVFKLGGLMQSLKAFGQIQESLSYFIGAYTQLAQFKAICDRLTSFVNHLNQVDVNAEQAKQIKIDFHNDRALTVKNVSINTPDLKPLLNHINMEFKQGHHYIIKGESGLGKSTFIRTLAGIWPFASGEVFIPENQSFMFLPQKPYMPMGTLAEAILFPDKPNSKLANQLEDVMRECHLEKFIPRLNETAYWGEQLSPGEQQRIAFARVLLHKPHWVFLDESTSMLDTNNETHLYQMLRDKLSECTIISIGHHASVDEFHEHVVHLSKFNHPAQVTA